VYQHSSIKLAREKFYQYSSKKRGPVKKLPSLDQKFEEFQKSVPVQFQKLGKGVLVYQYSS
jgi:hypothetical protein